jgi:predicted Zn finger-like uncharacterized protein
MTVLVSLRCPSCSTRFGLSASRVRPQIRRARCFKCRTEFGIEEAVAQLLAPEAQPAERPPSLTLGDLEGTGDDLLEKTLVTVPAPPPPEASPYVAGGANYASAKDAVARLMGPAAIVRPPSTPLMSSRTMDVEATLSALDQTLSGTLADEPPFGTFPPPGEDSASTLKLSLHEIQAAMASAAPSASAEPALDPLAPEPTLLKVQLEQETCNNVPLERMARWIEDGRVREYHMVARQFSDHWIEASKVPALRPFFDQRKRRAQVLKQEDLPIPPPEILPPKKGLFGGLFGRN